MKTAAVKTTAVKSPGAKPATVETTTAVEIAATVETAAAMEPTAAVKSSTAVKAPAAATAVKAPAAATVEATATTGRLSWMHKECRRCCGCEDCDKRYHHVSAAGNSQHGFPT
jgi:hypothetical protein